MDTGEITGRTSNRRVGQTLMAVQISAKWSYFLRNLVVPTLIHLPQSTHTYVHTHHRLDNHPSLFAFGDPVPRVEREQFGLTSGLPNGRESLHYGGDTRERLTLQAAPLSKFA